MQTRGAELFSRLSDAPSPTQLGNVLRKYHGANDKQVTELLHPTVCSSLSLSLVHLEDDLSDWSPRVVKLNKMLLQLNTMTKLYIYGDLLRRARVEIEAERICQVVDLSDADDPEAALLSAVADGVTAYKRLQN
jgi:hypothetical protein